jgi:hypothetical protein
MAGAAGLVCAFVLTGWALAQDQPLPFSPPTEVDTLNVGQSAEVVVIEGRIELLTLDGRRMTLAPNAIVQAGDFLLVRAGAAFRIGSDVFGPEKHGDRWVRLQ